MTCQCLNHCYADGKYALPPLPYGESALEPMLDAETVALHHDRHHAAYVTGANEAADTLLAIADGELDAALAPAATRNLAFNLGGHILHSLYWQNMSPEPKARPEGKLARLIDECYGSFEGMLRLFITTARSVQGSGWAVLGLDSLSRRPRIFAIHNHQDAASPAFLPLMVCDVWEHAYYLRYRNKCPDYIEAFLKVADWAAAEERFNALCCHE